MKWFREPDLARGPSLETPVLDYNVVLAQLCSAKGFGNFCVAYVV